MDTIMTKLHSVLSGTPPWVFFVFVYLVFIGIRATKDREVHIGKIFLMPGIFFALFLIRLIAIWRLDICAIFLTALTVALFLSHFFIKRESPKIHGKYVFIKGSCETLIVVMTIFCLKYFFGYMRAVNGELEKYLIAEIIISGTTTGFLLNKIIRYAGLISLRR
jgi:membrane protein CcdC involved in cytochrome C biogenesis